MYYTASPQLPKVQLFCNIKMMEKNYLTWHFSQAFPDFAKSRLKQLFYTIGFFNILGLLKTLFAPYRRLEITDKTPSLADKISFNLISRIIGASVRLIIIIAAVPIVLLMLIFEAILVVFYLIPIFSFMKYNRIRQNSLLTTDLENSSQFAKKLTGTKLFSLVSIFFPGDFGPAFSNLPDPSTVDISPNDTPKNALVKLAQNFQKLSIYLEQKNIKLADFELLVSTLNEHLEKPAPIKPSPIGQLLAFGYTNTLDRFSQELTSQTMPHVPGGKFELLEEITKVLTRPKNNNVLLVGEPGVGRHTTLHFLASAIAHQQLTPLAGARLVFLDAVALAGTGKNLVEVKSNFEAVLAQAKHAGNIILAIDQIDRLSSSTDGRIDLSEVLITILTDNSLPIIGISTLDDFNKYIRPNSNFLKLFEKIDISEASPEQTLEILVSRALEIYQNQKIATTFEAILEIVKRSNKLLADRRQPEKSIILFDDLTAEAKSRKQSIVDVGLVDEVISQKTKTPVGKISKTEASKLKNLEDLLHKRIIGQNEAIEEIARAMRRARAEIETGTRPIGSFLFLGPTGVGKTETAKALAESFFGKDDRMARFDMSEYQSTDGLKRLIGDPEYRQPGILANAIRENPYGLLLVDEFEKANSAVHNLFLQILDEGFMTDAFGKKVNFDNVIIIATSNAGAEFIREQISQEHPRGEVEVLPGKHPGGESGLSQKLIEYVLQKNLFSPELINRFDGVIVYHPLSNDQAVAVAKLMLGKLAQNLKEGKNIQLDLTDQLAQAVAKKGFDPTFGARPMRRLIADKIEDEIAKMIIEGSVKNGDTISSATLLKFVS